ncbi:MAG: DUF6268 family outer membrane beta-barrel protein [Verrucomicrobiales bacterium]|jgi:opacity protein-like surface antigen|nr:DUF6268 family outer membrane beta-barrel protein [Verrucomicrobiales bacterium]
MRGLLILWCLGLGARLAVAADSGGQAADLAQPDWLRLDTPQQRPAAAVSHEFNFSESYVGGSDIHRGPTSYGRLRENRLELSYIVSAPLAANWQLRAGLDYQRYDFGSLRGDLLPDTLSGAALVLGADFNLAAQWILRFEARPGVYGDFKSVTTDQVNVPLIIGATYLVNADLQWFFGAQLDPRFGTGLYHWDDCPVLPGVGVRWRFADQWTLLAMLPDPELQYDALDDLQVYVGARLRGGNYRTGKNFGHAAGRGNLANANLAYREIRVGLGARYTLWPGVTLEAEGGSAVTRQFYYSGADLQFHSDPAAYAQIQCKAQF